MSVLRYPTTLIPTPTQQPTINPTNNPTPNIQSVNEDEIINNAIVNGYSFLDNSWTSERKSSPKPTVMQRTFTRNSQIPRKKQVHFPSAIVTGIYTRPITTYNDIPLYYYTKSDYKRFKEEARGCPILQKVTKILPKASQQCESSRYTHAANSLLKTVDIDMNNIQQWAIIDSGATSNFIMTDAPVVNIKPAIQPLTAMMPDGETVTSTHTCELDMPMLPPKAREGHRMPGLKHSLIAVIKLCNAGCEVKFTKIGCTISYRGRIILHAHKCTNNGMWMVPLTQQQATTTDSISNVPNEVVNNIHTTTNKAELARYIHQLLLSPPKSTLLQAIKNTKAGEGIHTIPGLTYELISKHLPASTATEKGHMQRQRQGVRSTRSQSEQIRQARADVDDMFPPEEACAVHDMIVFAAIADKNTGTMYTDYTGQFPARSYHNMLYLFVAYVYDINAIIIRAIPNRQETTLQKAFEDVVEYLDDRGCKPTLNVMDNECSKVVEKYIKKENIDIQFVPPHNHRANAAERAIKTVKEHFISGLATVHYDCPLQLWDQFLEQAQDTLNLMRMSRRNNKISAYEELDGKFDFNKTPLAPIGTKALVYVDPTARTSWAPHGMDAWYTGGAKQHYRCLRFFTPDTKGYRITDTYKLYPTHSQLPTISEEDTTLAAAADILQVLKNTATISATAEQKLRHLRAIQQLTNILQNKPAPRVEEIAEPRVAMPSTSVDATAPRVVQRTRHVHQRHTRSNTPMPSTMEEVTPPPVSNNNNTGVNNNSTTSEKQPTVVTPSKKRKVNGVTIGSKRNSSKHISRQRLIKLIEAQTKLDRAAEYQRIINLQNNPIEPTKVPGSTPTLHRLVTYNMPDPKARHIPSITQEEDDNIDNQVQDEGQSTVRRSKRIAGLCNTTYKHSISPQALHHLAEKGILHAPEYTIPYSLENEKLHLHTTMDIEEMCNGVVHPVTKETITKYQTLANDPLLKKTWIEAMCIELGRLAQGYKDVEGTDTIQFLSHDEIKKIPKDRTITYARIVVDYRPQKDDPNRVRITVGGNLIDYPFELTTRTSDMTSAKTMWNSVISTTNARYVCADIKNFYLGTPLDRWEYMKMPLATIPQPIIDQYDLNSKAKNGQVYMAIKRGMYGLPQAGILANKLLKKRLAKHDYFEQPHTPGLWKHKTRPVWFNLTVDDFGIKYIGKEHADHLLNALREHYTIDVDWTGSLYCGIKLDWNYEQRHLDISMPKYVHKQLVRYEHKPPRRPQNCPYAPNPIQYGKNNQAPTPEDTSKLLDKADKKFIQQVVGSFLYYARAIDATILMALSEIAQQVSKPTENTMKRVKQFLDYMSTHPDAKIRYRASDMILNIHSDASYLSATKARSRAGGYFFLGSIPQDGKPIKLNGAIHITCTILKLVAASAAEAELGALFLNAQQAKIIRLMLEELGHPQPPTPIHIDNTTTVGIVNNTIKRQKSRAMEMRYFWLLCQEAQKNFEFIHQPGQENLGDYPSKNHMGDIHQHVRPYYVHMSNSPTELPRAPKPSSRRGCAKRLADPYHKKTPLPSLSSTECLACLHERQSMSYMNGHVNGHTAQLLLS